MQYASNEDYARYCPHGAIPEDDLDTELDAASRDVDGLTYNRIVKAGFDALTPYQQELVRRAVCEQAEFRHDNADMLETPLSSYSINGVSMQFGGNVRELGGVVTTRQITNLLQQTGLTYRGLDWEVI